MLERQYKVEIAKKYGIYEAIFIHNIAYWLKKNIANRKHFYDGYVWTYNSLKAFAEMFEEFSEDQIRRTIERLVEKGILKKGNYNKIAYDRTMWYTIIKEDILEAYKIDYSICRNEKIDLADLPNGKSENAEPIPNLNTKTLKPKPPTNEEADFKKSEGGGINVIIKKLINNNCDYKYDYEGLYTYILNILNTVENIKNPKAYILRLIEKYKDNFRIIAEKGYYNYKKVIEREKSNHKEYTEADELAINEIRENLIKGV